MHLEPPRGRNRPSHPTLEKRTFSGPTFPRPTHGRGPSPSSPAAMWHTRTSRGLVVRAPAKVNLFLEVLGKRPDGYHDLATLMVAVSLYDTLEFKEERAKATVLDVLPDLTAPAGADRPLLSAGPDNLVRRAVDLLRRRFGRNDGVRVCLIKRIP